MYDIVTNPIPRTGFFATPKSYQQLVDYIGSMSGPERALAMTIAHMSLNLAHELVNTEILSKEVFAQ